jgi:hypothetical protein
MVELYLHFPHVFVTVCSLLHTQSNVCLLYIIGLFRKTLSVGKIQNYLMFNPVVHLATGDMQ